MILNKILALSIAVLAWAYEVRANCKLEKPTLEANKGFIFAVETAGQLNLLRRERVNVGQTIHLICNDTLRTTAICNQGSILSRSLTLDNCDKPTKAIVQLFPDNACEKQMYRVGYKVNNDFLEIYRSCYDASKARAFYTIHDVYSSTIVTDRPSSWTMDGLITATMAGTFSASVVYKRFIMLLGTEQSYSTSLKHTLIHRGHLTPSGDFLFINNIKATFKYLNVVPQFNSINYGNWKFIEGWVRTQLDPSLPSKVVTGALDVLQVPISRGSMTKKRLYLANQDDNPIPKWMFKFISIARQNLPIKCYVFLTYNNIIYDEDPIVSDLCIPVVCPTVPGLNTIDKTYGKTYCCEPTRFKAQHLGLVVI